ncbi:MAG: RNA methyltransferase [Treponema sp.]|jgi:TrmH RNA methyltransferase|nr:RNA methyltransferase [Treponema sp.]
MRNKLTDELAVCGFNAVLAAAEYHPQTINRLFLREDRLQSFTGICKQLAERKRPYKICDDEELERICKSVHHQGVVAMIEEPVIEPLSLEDLEIWADERKTGVVLYSVGNDHNLGAIARAAAFFDVSFIVLNEKDASFEAHQEGNLRATNLRFERSAEVPADVHLKDDAVRLTTSAYRVAEGAFEHLTIRSVTNMAAFLKDASKRIVTIGTDTRARRRIGDLGGIFKTVKTRPGIALVLGNEETGLPKNVKDRCSHLLRIPGTGNIESLNVSQAAALFLHAIWNL